MPRLNNTNKATPVGADIIPIYDSEDTAADKSITLTQVKAFSATDISGKQNLIASPTNNNIVTTDGSGQTKDSGIASSLLSSFNGNSQLIQTDSSGKYPALNGSLITNVSVTINKNVTQIGTCSTVSATAEKAVTLSGFTLATGATIQVTFANANTTTTPTLNVNSTGAKAIYNEAGTAVGANNPAYFPANSLIEFIYDGTNWIFKKRTIQNYVNGANWYRIYSDGWIEQGGSVSATGTGGGTSQTITLNTSHKNTNYTLKRTTLSTDLGSALSGGLTGYISKSTGSFNIYTSSTYMSYVDWETKGY